MSYSCLACDRTSTQIRELEESMIKLKEELAQHQKNAHSSSSITNPDPYSMNRWNSYNNERIPDWAPYSAQFYDQSTGLCGRCGKPSARCYC